MLSIGYGFGLFDLHQGGIEVEGGKYGYVHVGYLRERPLGEVLHRRPLQTLFERTQRLSESFDVFLRHLSRNVTVWGLNETFCRNNAAAFRQR